MSDGGKALSVLFILAHVAITDAMIEGTLKVWFGPLWFQTRFPVKASTLALQVASLQLPAGEVGRGKATQTQKHLVHVFLGALGANIPKEPLYRSLGT